MVNSHAISRAFLPEKVDFQHTLFHVESIIEKLQASKSQYLGTFTSKSTAGPPEFNYYCF